MRLLSLSGAPRQRLQSLLEDGSSVSLALRYLPAIEQWSIDIEHKNFILYGHRVYNSYNILNQFSLRIPFGINVVISDGGEPSELQDFSSERVKLYLLDKEEVKQVEAYYSGRLNPSFSTGETNG